MPFSSKCLFFLAAILSLLPAARARAETIDNMGPRFTLTDQDQRIFHQRRVMTGVGAVAAAGALVFLIVTLRRRTARRARVLRDTPKIRHDRALRTSAITAVTVFVLLWAAFVLSIYTGIAPPLAENAERRVQLMFYQSLEFSLACALVGYGISRLRLRIRFGARP